MTKTIALVLALAVAAPYAASAATAQSNTQTNANFSQGRHAAVLSDGPSTGYNSFGNR